MSPDDTIFKSLIKTSISVLVWMVIIVLLIYLSGYDLTKLYQDIHSFLLFFASVAVAGYLLWKL